ncbi:unnamed protein product, partial [Prorocentrum cordatum]
ARGGFVDGLGAPRRGDLRATSDCLFLVLGAAGFAKVISGHRSAHAFAAQYARKFGRASTGAPRTTWWTPAPWTSRERALFAPGVLRCPQPRRGSSRASEVARRALDPKPKAISLGTPPPALPRSRSPWGGPAPARWPPRPAACRDWAARGGAIAVRRGAAQ